MTVAEWREQKRSKRRGENSKYYEKSKATNLKEGSKKKEKSSSPEARRKEKERKRKRLREEALNKKRELDRVYKQKLRIKENKIAKNNISKSEIDGAFHNKMSKSRAMRKLKNALPTTPNKKTALLVSYLDSKSHRSPTIETLQNLNVVVSPEEQNVNQLGKAVLNDIRNVVSSTKHRRSDDARIAKNIITASVSGNDVVSSKKA